MSDESFACRDCGIEIRLYAIFPQEVAANVAHTPRRCIDELKRQLEAVRREPDAAGGHEHPVREGA